MKKYRVWVNERNFGVIAAVDDRAAVYAAALEIDYKSDQSLKCRECTIDFVQFTALLDKITRADFGGWAAAAEFFEDDYDSMVSWLGVNPWDLDDLQEVILRRAMIMRGENLARDLALLTAYEEYTTLLGDERKELSDKILGPTGYWGACA